VVRHAEAPVTTVDISRDLSMLVIGSKDGTAYICDIANKGVVMQKLNFKPAPTQKNMMMRTCIFARDNSIYTLCT